MEEGMKRQLKKLDRDSAFFQIEDEDKTVTGWPTQTVATTQHLLPSDADMVKMKNLYAHIDTLTQDLANANDRLQRYSDLGWWQRFKWVLGIKPTITQE